MKYIKTYEHNNPNEPKFKVGDTVYSIKNTMYLTTDRPYTIAKVIRTNYNYITYALKGINFHSYIEDSFISELEYNANKYNL